MTYYAVHTGHNPGIYMTWETAKKQVDGYQGAMYKGFKNIKDAEHFVRNGNLFTIKTEEPAAQPIPNKDVTLSTLPVKFTSISRSPPAKQQETAKLNLASLTLTPIEKLLAKYKQHPDYQPSKQVVHIYTDGSTIRNGSKHATGGYGVFIPGTSHVKERLIARELMNGKITNCVAELKAINRALEEILQIHIEVKHELAFTFIIHYDSTYAADVITGKKSAKANLELVTAGKDLLKECSALSIRVSFEHVYSHTGKQDLFSLGNELADKLADVHNN